MTDETPLPPEPTIAPEHLEDAADEPTEAEVEADEDALPALPENPAEPGEVGDHELGIPGPAEERPATEPDEPTAEGDDVDEDEADEDELGEGTVG